MVALKLKTSVERQPDFLVLPWDLPLEQWPDELAIRLPRGRHRHVVRFIEHERGHFALKELSPELAHREYDHLWFLAEEGLPAVELVGVADERITRSGESLDAILITRHLSYSLPYLHLFAGPGADGLHDSLVDALVILLVRIHLVGLFWGDCSLGNALFRRDAGALVAHLVDAETSERHESLTRGQRALDLDIAMENIAGGLFELDALGRLGPGVDPVVVVERLRLRYEALWAELTHEEKFGPDEMWRVRDRLRRLNELGFDTVELEMVEKDGDHRVSFRPRIVEEGHHRHRLRRLTGIEAGENQARRLLGAIGSFAASLGAETGAEVPEAVVAYRWLTERFQPTIQAVPRHARDRLTDAELFHHVLDHVWYLSEAAGTDVGLEEATADFVASVLPQLPSERTVLDLGETAVATLPTDET